MLSLSATYCTGSDDKVVACFLSQQLIALVVTTKLNEDKILKIHRNRKTDGQTGRS